MTGNPVKIRSALISVYHKTGLDRIVKKLHADDVKIYSTGGTYTFFEDLGIPALKIEDLTGYPSILGGRVKTLHPKVFGAILGRPDNDSDIAEMDHHHIPTFDLVIVDLYPFEDTVLSGASETEIIEKIDIGGISLIRAAAKNFEHVVIIPSQQQYGVLEDILFQHNGTSSYEQRRSLAAQSFLISSHYDGLITKYLSGKEIHDKAVPIITPLRYGENPHQNAEFAGNLDQVFNKIHGKELSFNNLVDVDAALELIGEFEDTCFCVIKHTNPCGVATANTVKEAWQKALDADPVSAFGGILACNRPIDTEAAAEIDKIFFEVLIATEFSDEALEILMRKKNRIILKSKIYDRPGRMSKSILNGSLIQDRDNKTEVESDIKTVTQAEPGPDALIDMVFANKIVKHAKSNTIVLVKNRQLIGIGVGQTSRVDALEQAIAKAKHFNFDTTGAVMASDAFFPFPDCVQIAHESGISAVIQPGGSIRDQESIDYCNNHAMPMVVTGNRHFKH